LTFRLSIYFSGVSRDLLYSGATSSAYSNAIPRLFAKCCWFVKMIICDIFLLGH
jgi:hypothetical protein